MKKMVFLFLFIPFVGMAQDWQDILNQVKDQLNKVNTAGTVDIASGLKEALNNGITKQVTKLTATDGFYKNEMVKILLPAELQKVDKTLRKMGMSKLADSGIKSFESCSGRCGERSHTDFCNSD